MPILYHVSDQPGIKRFDPRPPPSQSFDLDGEMVWAIDERLIHNYLLPRDCPRVTFYAGPNTFPADVDRFLAGSSARHVVAIETNWLEKLRNEKVHLYSFRNESFKTLDDCAGYYISREPVVPFKEECVDDMLGALVARDIELRIMPSLWPLRDLVIETSLQFSVIRWRNAQPPPEGYTPRRRP